MTAPFMVGLQCQRGSVLLNLALISALVFESSQLQSAQVRVVLARNSAIIVRSEHYEPVAMRDPGAKIRSAGSTHYPFANFVRISDRMIFALIRRPGSGVSDASDVAFGGRTDMPVCTAHVCF